MGVRARARQRDKGNRSDSKIPAPVSAHVILQAWGKKATRVGSQPLTNSHVRCGACSRAYTLLHTPRSTDALGECKHPSAVDHQAATAARVLRRSSQGLHTVRARPREGSQRRKSPPMREDRRDRLSVAISAVRNSEISEGLPGPPAGH